MQNKLTNKKEEFRLGKETNDLAKLLGDNPETLAGNLLKLRPGLH